MHIYIFIIERREDMKTRYATHPEYSKTFDTAKLRQHYLIENLFEKGKSNYTYSHIDRVIVGGIVPLGQPLPLASGDEISAPYFFERREGGVINIGGNGAVILDKEKIELNNKDALYIGRGAKEVIFESEDENNPAVFYLNSCPAHKSFKSTKISLEDAKKVNLGNSENLNVRTINQYIHPDVVESCQLVMGLTSLQEGSVWNTMPCHTHERRMEVYMYFDMKDDDRVFHFMGEPKETRHILVKKGQAVISPSWSIHSGVGTGRYAFIWGMCGENNEFDDMDFVTMDSLL